MYISIFTGYSTTTTTLIILFSMLHLYRLHLQEQKN